MISKKDILNMVRRIKRKTDGVPDRALMHPNREWFIGLILFLFVAGVGGVYNAQLYLNYLTLDERLTGEATFIETYRQSNADEALKIFGNKKITYSELRGGIIPVPTDVEITDEDEETEEGAEDHDLTPEEEITEVGTTTADSVVEEESEEVESSDNLLVD